MTATICNSGPLIALGKLQQLTLLSDQYPHLIIPQEVYQEVVVAGLLRGAEEAIAVRDFCARTGCRILESPSEQRHWQPVTRLDPGETAVLRHALQTPDCTLLMDDELARVEARRLGFTVYGSLGIITRACKANRISLALALSLLQTLGARPDIWISHSLCERVSAELIRSVKQIPPDPA